MDIVEEIDAYFKSGNSITVSCAAIKNEEWKAVRELIESLRNQLSTNTSDGWKLVPIEPTEEMILSTRGRGYPYEYYKYSVACGYENVPVDEDLCKDIYQGMIIAAPTHKER